MRKTFFISFTLIGVLAHHAREFIIVESYYTPAKSEKIIHMHYDYYVRDSSNKETHRWEITPAFSYGI
ncbi:MAG: hypothetical protein NZ870_03895, partial [bacterium]|nr:hypothetical protein [bacterium]